MLASVNELGLDNALTFTRIDWGQKQNKEFLYRLPLNIELTGTTMRLVTSLRPSQSCHALLVSMM